MSDSIEVTNDRTASPAPTTTPPWMTIAGGLAVALASAGVVLLLARQPRRPASEVESDVHRLVLEGNGDEDALLGSWTIGASDYDEASGELLNLRVQSGPMYIAARRARVVVDPDDDSFGFLLTKVVITRAETAGGTSTMLAPIGLDSYWLGPIPVDANVVADTAWRGDRVVVPGKKMLDTLADGASDAEFD